MNGILILLFINILFVILSVYYEFQLRTLLKEK